MKLSLCIATFNEETNIHYPLDSAYDFVDEVIIVDGGSTDKTVEKAKSYGKKVKIIHFPNPPMFHINKQKAIDAARGEWILQLDADEALSDELKQEIVKLLDSYIVKKNNSTIQQFNNSPLAYWIPRKNWFLTGFLTKGGQFPDYTIRLYKNGAVRFPLKSVHENVEFVPTYHLVGGMKAVKTNIGHLNNPILHYADPDFSRYLKRWDRYTTLDADLLFKSMKQSSNATMFFSYFIFKPLFTFFSMYFRHLGFKDGFPGFVFALFSSIRYWVIYIKYFQKIKSA